MTSTENLEEYKLVEGALASKPHQRLQEPLCVPPFCEKNTQWQQQKLEAEMRDLYICIGNDYLDKLDKQNRGIKAFRQPPTQTETQNKHVSYLTISIKSTNKSQGQPPQPNPTPTLYNATILEGWHSFTGSSGIGTAKTFPKIWFDWARAFKGLSDLPVDSRRKNRTEKPDRKKWEGKISGWLWCVYVYVYDVCMYVWYVNLIIWVQKLSGFVYEIAIIWCIQLYTVLNDCK